MAYGFFGPIDMNMWQGKGWEYVRERVRDKAASERVYQPGYGMHLLEYCRSK